MKHESVKRIPGWTYFSACAVGGWLMGYFRMEWWQSLLLIVTLLWTTERMHRMLTTRGSRTPDHVIREQERD
jgi:hypothetical protein